VLNPSYWNRSPVLSGRRLALTRLDTKTPSWGDTWIARLDEFGNVSCAEAGGCADEPVIACSDDSLCTSNACTAGACSFVDLPDGLSCGGVNTCVSGECVTP
jgi:hypothetical protein